VPGPTASALRLPALEGTFGSLQRHRNYRLYFAGQLASFTGSWMQDTALPWLMLSLTHSAFDVGLVAFCRYAPFTLLSLVSGAAADRFDSRRFLYVTQACAMTVATALAVLSATGRSRPWELFVLAALGGTVTVFDNPARFRFLVRVVGPEDAPNAIALHSGLTNTARIVGPALAGVVIATSGVTACFVVNALSFLAIIVSLVLMREREFEPVEAVRRLPVRRAAREGLSFVRRGRSEIRVVLALVLAMSVTGFNFRVLLPVLASKTLHSGAVVFGLLFSAYGVGAITGALFAASAGATNWRRIVLATTGFSAAMLILAPLRSVPAAMLLLVCVGLGYSLWTSQSQAMLLLAAPQALRGRMASLYLFALVGLAPFGGMLAGWLATVGGTELAFGTAGGVGLFCSAAAAFKLRNDATVDTPTEGLEPVEPAPEGLT
jgi:MFS family permease